jgi:DNA-binding CsgD family transcriptional regulator
MDQLNETIADLYDLAIETNLHHYRKLAFDKLSDFCKFDSCVWASGRELTMSDGAPRRVIRTMHLIGQDPSVPVRFGQEYAQDDAIHASCIASPGRCFRIEDTMPIEAYRGSPLYQGFARQCGIEYAMGTVFADSIVNLFEYLVLWRADRSNPFTDEERARTELLALHMVGGWRHCQLLELQRAPIGTSTSAVLVRRARALTDSSGLILTADSDFGEIVREVFSGWLGPSLPFEFRNFVESALATVVVGELTLQIVRGDDYHILTVIGTPREMPLSPSEYEVAKLYSAGMSNSEIASIRHVSATTVRNQLAAIYEKLSIHSKVELARMIA